MGLIILTLGAKAFSRERSPTEDDGKEQFVSKNILLMQLGLCMIWIIERTYITSLIADNSYYEYFMWNIVKML